jgi:16S rRNA (guanine527-N7)-methyltransferase
VSDGPPESALAESVRAALLESQRLGFLGDRTIDDVVEHARAFVAALEGTVGHVIDLGSGGGIPGLVVAHDRPDLELTLVDRRSKRTDYLERVVRRLRWEDRVTVLHADVHEVIARSPNHFDAVTARGFGPPTETLTVGVALAVAGGPIIISEPPGGDRWDPELLDALAVRRAPMKDERVVCFRTIPDHRAS